MKDEKGITLIALVITIIVLLILAGVAISALTGNEGILSNSKEATEKYNNRVELENQILAQLAEYLEDGTGGGNNNSGGSTDNPGGNTDNPGGGTETPPEETVTDVKADLVKNPDKYENTEQETITDDIAIGENGEKVNLDLWNYYLETPETGSYYVLTNQRKAIGNYESSASSYWTEWKCSYKGNIENGTIEGKIPAYIYNKTTKMAFPVKIIVNLFMDGDYYSSSYDTAVEKAKMLTNIEIPSTITEIGSCAFYNCTGLENITIPSTVTKIGPGAFSGTGLSNMIIPETVTEIGEGAFGNCTKLKTVVIPDGITEIPTGAFDYNSALESITIPNTVTKISEYAFRKCTNLKTIVIPDGVAEISWATFEYCSALENITIPRNVTKIGSTAFRDCTALKQVNYSGSETEWSKISIGHSNEPLSASTITITYDYKK